MDETLLKLDQVRQKKGLLAILKADLKRQMDSLLRPASLALRQSVITLVFGWVGLGLIGMGWVGVFGFGLVWFGLDLHLFRSWPPTVQAQIWPPRLRAWIWSVCIEFVTRTGQIRAAQAQAQIWPQAPGLELVSLY